MESVKVWGNFHWSPLFRDGARFVPAYCSSTDLKDKELQARKNRIEWENSAAAGQMNDGLWVSRAVCAKIPIPEVIETDMPTALKAPEVEAEVSVTI